MERKGNREREQESELTLEAVMREVDGDALEKLKERYEEYEKITLEHVDFFIRYKMKEFLDGENISENIKQEIIFWIRMYLKQGYFFSPDNSLAVRYLQDFKKIVPQMNRALVLLLANFPRQVTAEKSSFGKQALLHPRGRMIPRAPGADDIWNGGINDNGNWED